MKGLTPILTVSSQLAKVGGVSEPQEENQLQTPVALTQGSQKEEAVESKGIIVNIKKTNEKSYENAVDIKNVGDQEMLNKDYFENSHENDSAGPWEHRPRT